MSPGSSPARCRRSPPEPTVCATLGVGHNETTTGDDVALTVELLSLVADAMGRPIGIGDPAAAQAELGALWQTGTFAPKASAPAVAASTAPPAGSGQAVLSTFHHLLDEGSLQDGEVHLAATRPEPVLRLSQIGQSSGWLMSSSSNTTPTPGSAP